MATQIYLKKLVCTNELGGGIGGEAREIFLLVFLIGLCKEGGQVLDKLELNPIRQLSENNMSDFSNCRLPNIVIRLRVIFFI